MKINIQYEQIPADKSLSVAITKKLNILHHKFNWILKADVVLKLEHNSLRENQICEIELSAPGPRLFASSKATDFEKAVNLCLKELEPQLDKRKHWLANY